jgi:uncharacterized protein (DUF2164 family)
VAKVGPPLQAIPRAEKLEAVKQLQQYLEDELEVQAGDLGAELLLDFVAELVGPVYYNAALDDARLVVMRRDEALQEDLAVLERTVQFREAGRRAQSSGGEQ